MKPERARTTTEGMITLLQGLLALALRIGWSWDNELQCWRNAQGQPIQAQEKPA